MGRNGRGSESGSGQSIDYEYLGRQLLKERLEYHGVEIRTTFAIMASRIDRGEEISHEMVTELDEVLRQARYMVDTVEVAYYGENRGEVTEEFNREE